MCAPGLGRRFLGRLLDAIIVGIPVSIILAIAGLPAQTFGLGGVEAWLTSAVTAVLWMAYYVLLEANGGATLGERIVGIRVTTVTGTDPSYQAAAVRNLWLLFGLIPLVGGLVQLVAVIVIAVTIGSNPQHRGKHDEFAGTGVCRPGSRATAQCWSGLGALPSPSMVARASRRSRSRSAMSR